jgi:predicted XRE-type DNA-binding protein
MDKAKRERLEQAGWKVSSTEEFLGLSAEESAYIEVRLRLSEELRRLRMARQMTQAQVARMIASSQSRVAKAEAADQSVSLDLLIRSLLAMGASDRDLARAIEGRAPHAAVI